MNRYEQDQRREDEASIGEAEYWEGKTADFIDCLSEFTPDQFKQIRKAVKAEKQYREFEESIPF